MKTDVEIENRLVDAFGSPMTPADRGRLNARFTALTERSTAPRRRFGSRLPRVLLLVASVTLLVPALVAGGVALLNTEAPYGLGSAGTYDAELAAAKAVTPIPPGATWPPYLDGAKDRGASYAVGLGQSMVEMNAYCLWLGSWYEAHQAGDTATADAAVTVLDQARGWTSFNGPTADRSFRNHTNAVIDAVDRGDASPVLDELRLNCQGTWPAGAGR